MQIKIKEEEIINKTLQNDLYKVLYDNTIKEFVILSQIDNRLMESTSDVNDLRYYGFNIKVLRKATLEVMESIADENGCALFRSSSTGRWFLQSKNNINHIESYLEEYGYYI